MPRKMHKYASSVRTPAASRGPTDSLVFWFGIGFILLFLLIAPFQTALFNGYLLQYERGIYSSVAWSAVILFTLSIYLFMRRGMNETRDWLTVLAWGLPLAYALSFITAVSPHQTSVSLYLNVMYATFFALAAYFARSRTGSSLIQFGVMASGYIVVFYCYLNMFGNTYYRDAVMADQGLRLTSVFQYANAYAAYLIALLLCCLYYILSSRRWYAVAIHAVMLVPLFISFLLTMSRGGIVVLPIILLAVLPFLSIARQLLFFIYMLIGLGASFLITDRVKTISAEMLQRMLKTITPQHTAQTVTLLDPLSFKGWLTVVPTALVTGAVIVLLQMYAAPRLEQKLDKLSRKKWSNAILPAVICLAGIAGIFALSQLSFLAKLLPESLRQRVESINFQQHSVLERLTMFKDSLKLFKEYPLFGGGGGVWSTLHIKIQSAPYIPRQVHSFFLQYFDETGLVGMLLLFALLGFVLYLYIKRTWIGKAEERERSLPFYMVVVAILIHSSLDFEMSYGFIAALVFLCLGGMAAAIPGEIRPDGRPALRFLDGPAGKFAYPALMCIVSVLVFIVSIVNLRANALFYSAVAQRQEGKPMQEVLVPLDAAIRLAPGNPTFVLEKVDYLHQAYQQTKDQKYWSEAGDLIARLKAKEPYHVNVLEADYAHHVLAEDIKGALSVAYERLESDRWGLSLVEGAPNWFERAIALNYQIGMEAKAQQNTAEMNKYWDDALKMYRTVQDRLKELALLPKEQLHEPFGVTPVMAYSIGEIYSARGDYAAAADVLKPVLSDDWKEEINRLVTRAYLVSLQKLGKNDQALYDKFTSQFPQEKKEIEAAANSRA